MRVKEYISKWRRKREWRRLPLTEYPLEYVGKTDMFIARGTPLAPGERRVVGAPQGRRYVRPNGLEIILHKKDVRTRET